MKRLLVGAICLAVLLLAQCAALPQAQEYPKYTQPPDMNPSYSFASATQFSFSMVSADDWVCADGNAITKVRWWGSYWTCPSPGAFTAYSDMLHNAPIGGITGFTISIFDNVPAGDPANTLGFSHPGTLLAQYNPSGNCSETFHGTVVMSASPYVYADIYNYSTTLTVPFPQEQGKTYWLAVAASLPDITKQWGWHETDGHWNAYAVQTTGTVPNEWLDWYIPCGGHDLAFELVCVPEPGSLAALAVGLMGLVGYAGRMRLRSR